MSLGYFFGGDGRKMSGVACFLMMRILVDVSLFITRFEFSIRVTSQHCSLTKVHKFLSHARQLFDVLLH
jgi:hypothetical protein